MAFAKVIGMSFFNRFVFIVLLLLSCLEAFASLPMKCDKLLSLAELEKETPLPILRKQYLANQYGGKLSKDSYGEEWLRKLVSENPKMDNFLSALPTSLRRSHVLVIESKSTQFGSTENPRVILSNSDSTFLLAYSGDPNERGYNAVEVAIFDQENSEFVPYEIEITRDGKLLDLQKNPAKCIRCHSENFRPIWNAYPFWPRFYGSRASPDSKLITDFLKVEENALKDFIANSRYTGRYQPLIGNKSLEELESLNSALTVNLAGLNVKRIKKLIQKMAASNPKAYSLVGVAIRELTLNRNPVDFKSYLDAEAAQLYDQVIGKLILNTEERLTKNHASAIADHLSALNLDISPIAADSSIWASSIGMSQFDANVVYTKYRTHEQNMKNKKDYVIKMANLRFVVEVLGKMSISDWSMSPATDHETLPFHSTTNRSAWTLF